jgi:hypothetical protein
MSVDKYEKNEDSLLGTTYDLKAKARILTGRVNKALCN